jgi:hypothetical protein
MLGSRKMDSVNGAAVRDGSALKAGVTAGRTARVERSILTS